jgi:hypothetical protein
MRKLLALTFCALSLSACSWLGLEDDDVPPPVAANTICPQVASVRELSIYQHPPAANEDNLVINARMGKIKTTCGGVGDGMKIESSFDVIAIKGINSQGHLANLPFFVSVVNAQDEVEHKDLYEIPVEFENGAGQLRINIPFSTTVTGNNAMQKRVLIGFNLSPEQVQANSSFMGTAP